MVRSKIIICRVYDPPAYKEGLWVLVDRLWPRGLKKDALAFDLWLKDISPSPSLRKWFNHDPMKWSDFTQRYTEELKNKTELTEQLLKQAKDSRITLFYAAKDTQHNHALVLQHFLQSAEKTHCNP